VVFFDSKKDQGCDSVVIPSCSWIVNCFPSSGNASVESDSSGLTRVSFSSSAYIPIEIPAITIIAAAIIPRYLIFKLI